MKTEKGIPTLISLFTGAMGLDLGFELEGFEIRVALDNDPNAVETIKKNRPNIPVINQSLANVETEEILEKANLNVGEPDVVAGGSPCQSFSTAGRRLSIEEKRGQLVFEFLRVVEEVQPKFFVFENVSGLVSAAIKHISFYERVKKSKEEIAPEEKLGSAFDILLDRFRRIKTPNTIHYGINWDVLNGADYGAPQKRKRLVILGSRDGKKIAMPPTTHSAPESPEVVSKQKKPWVTLGEAFKSLDDPSQEYLPFPSWGKYMKYIPEGGCWRDLPREVKEEAMGGAYHSQGGRTGFYRRLSRDKPAPTLVTSPVFKGSVLAHPTENRPLSIEEYAKIQGFPNEWKIVGHIRTKYRMIGQAVPIPLARALARRLLEEFEQESLLSFENQLLVLPEHFHC